LRHAAGAAEVGDHPLSTLLSIPARDWELVVGLWRYYH
jgi:hypothetical protein